MLGTLNVGCSPAGRGRAARPLADGPSAVEGTATFASITALPVDAIFEATLLDVSRLDAPGAALGSRTIVSPPQPISFTIPFDGALIDQERNYAVRARILADGRPRWVSDRAYPVLTQGAGRTVSLVMRPTGSTDDRTPVDSVVVLSGELTYLADLPRLTECTSRHVFPVSTEGDFPALLRRYLHDAARPGAPLFVTFDGMIASRREPGGDGTTATVVVKEFHGTWPDQSCALRPGTPLLLRTAWVATSLHGAPMNPISGHEEPRLTFGREAAKLRYSATAGCNGFRGDVVIRADEITFDNGIGTTKSCGTAIDARERLFKEALEHAATWQVRGNILRLRNEAGEVIAVFAPARLR